MVCTSTASAWGHTMKLMTWRVQGMEDRAWLAEGWIHSYSSGRGCVQDTGWVGHGYLSYCGGQQLSQLSQLRKGGEVLWGSENPFLWGAGVLQGMLSASKATITHWEASRPRASLNCCARRYQFIQGRLTALVGRKCIILSYCQDTLGLDIYSPLPPEL